MKKVRAVLCCFFLSAFSLHGFSQQVADTIFSPAILDPAYPLGQGPVVLIDEGHTNFHTREGRFSAFSHLLEKDGYMVQSSTGIFTETQLNSGKILVIANALHPSNLDSWSLPTPSAFSDAEISAVNEWVKNGGSLFLIADHMPFPGAAELLAASFGFKFYNGFAMKNGGKDIFTSDNGLIKNEITAGRNENERVISVQTFTGQAFEIPTEARPILILNSKYSMKMPATAWEFKKDTPTISAEGMVQGAYMNYGKGRVVIFGEAAMFTAQLQGKNKVGMNQESAYQNAQFLLNTIHWLDGIIGNQVN